MSFFFVAQLRTGLLPRQITEVTSVLRGIVIAACSFGQYVRGVRGTFCICLEVFRNRDDYDTFCKCDPLSCCFDEVSELAQYTSYRVHSPPARKCQTHQHPQHSTPSSHRPASRTPHPRMPKSAKMTSKMERVSEIHGRAQRPSQGRV